MSRVYIGFRIIIGIIFSVSGAVKLLDLVLFREIVEQFDILPVIFIDLFSVSVPTIELVAGILLLANQIVFPSLVSISVLTYSFIFAIAVNLFRGAEISCGCFGSLEFFNKISIWNIVFDLVLLGMLTSLLFKYYRKDGDYQFNPFLKYTLVFIFLFNVPYQKNLFEYSINALKITTIDWSEVWDIKDKSNGVIIDARDIHKYEQIHVKNAISIPYSDFQRGISGLNNMSKDRVLLVYCDSSLCSAAQKVALKLIKRGYKNVYHIKEGLEELDVNENKENLVYGHTGTS